MAGEYLLDTDACVAILRGKTQLTAWLTNVAPDSCHISSVTAFELMTGVAKCNNPAQQLAKVAELLDIVHVIPFDWLAAAAAARIRGLLEKQGQPIGQYDILIAGQAVALGLTLVTNNRSEFDRVPGLSCESWT